MPFGLFELRRFRWFQLLTRALDIPVSARVFGLPFPVTLRLGPNFSLLTRKRNPEKAERATFHMLLEEQRSPVLWDIGANVGLYGFDFAFRCPESFCLLVEPDPSNTRCLRRTAQRAGLKNVVLLEAAVSNQVGHADFALDQLTGATGQLDRGDVPFVERHHQLKPPRRRVATTTLDELLASHPPPSILKIDIEGGEHAALEGSRRMLHEIRPVIMVELSGGPETKTLLQSAGYVLYDWRSRSAAVEGTWAVMAVPHESAFNGLLRSAPPSPREDDALSKLPHQNHSSHWHPSQMLST